MLLLHDSIQQYNIPAFYTMFIYFDSNISGVLQRAILWSPLFIARSTPFSSVIVYRFEPSMRISAYFGAAISLACSLRCGAMYRSRTAG